MKKLVLSFLLLSLSAFVFGQSTLITPTGDEILVTKYGSGATPNMLGRISGGSATTPTATPANLGLLTIAGRGYITGGWVNSNNAAINLSANETFSSTGRGTFINFQTTADKTTSMVERMRINHNGNVGIGTNNPDSKLHLAGTSTGVTAPTNTLMTFENNGSVGLSFLSSSTGQSNITFGSSLGNSRGKLSYSPTSNDMIFSTNAIERMTIDGTGNVGIGTIMPNAKLEVSGDFSLGRKTTISVAGTQNALDRLGASIIYFNPSPNGTVTLNGIAGGFDGMIVYLINTLNNTLILNNENGAASFLNQIVTNTGAAITITGRGGVTLFYINNGWRVIGFAE